MKIEKCEAHSLIKRLSEVLDVKVQIIEEKCVEEVPIGQLKPIDIDAMCRTAKERLLTHIERLTLNALWEICPNLMRRNSHQLVHVRSLDEWVHTGIPMHSSSRPSTRGKDVS